LPKTTARVGGTQERGPRAYAPLQATIPWTAPANLREKIVEQLVEDFPSASRGMFEILVRYVANAKVRAAVLEAEDDGERLLAG
jgi:hypothetical protein